MSLTRERTTQLLSETRLFSGVDAEGLARISEQITELDVPADRVIARQGEIGTGFFIVVTGGVRVVRAEAKPADGAGNRTQRGAHAV